MSYEKPSIKRPDGHEALRDVGPSKSKAAAIANSDIEPSRSGGSVPAYEEWSKQDLLLRARDLAIEGRSQMTKDTLIQELRNN